MCGNESVTNTTAELYATSFGIDKLIKIVKVNEKGKIKFSFKESNVIGKNYYLKFYDKCLILANNCINIRYISLPTELLIFNLSGYKHYRLGTINLIHNDIFRFTRKIHTEKRCDLYNNLLPD
uniref:Uncharacterized protein n=1 Tax=Strongyloides stercoralis TaxID=6248 RepID=A0AAF5DCJ8_STRER